MVAVFAGFITNPDADIKPIGFSLAIGVLVGAFLVRTTLVPAVLALLRDRAWWLPRWLDRRLPPVDAELFGRLPGTSKGELILRLSRRSGGRCPDAARRVPGQTHHHVTSPATATPSCHA